MNELIKINNDNGKQTVSARDLHSFLEAKERFSTWIKRQFQYGLKEDVDFVGCKLFNALANQELDDYILTLDAAKQISMLQKSEKGTQARLYFIECEKKLKQIAPQSFAEALRLAYEQQLAIENQQKEIEYLEKTKAYISDKKTATAMNTASQKSKEVEKLKMQLGECKEFATIAAVERFFKNESFDWRELKRYCVAKELEIKTVPDKRYGSVKSYPAKAWIELYNVDLEELF
jgi:anti-repressor protein